MRVIPRLLSFTVLLAISATFETSAQSAASVEAKYLDGEPPLWKRGTTLIFKQSAEASRLELSDEGRKSTVHVVIPYMDLQQVRYWIEEGGGFWQRKIWSQPRHSLRFTWTRDPSETVFATIRIEGGDDNDICAQVRSVDRKWGEVLRANMQATMHCPFVRQQTSLMQARLLERFFTRDDNARR